VVLPLPTKLVEGFVARLPFTTIARRNTVAKLKVQVTTNDGTVQVGSVEGSRHNAVMVVKKVVLGLGLSMSDVREAIILGE
jgi:hypothetical protein